MSDPQGVLSGRAMDEVYHGNVGLQDLTPVTFMVAVV
jgi:hypothetical protein